MSTNVVSSRVGAGLVLELAVDREAELADGRALRRDPQLGIAREVADEEDFVEVGHGRGATRRRSDRLDEGAVDAAVEPEALAAAARGPRRGAEKLTGRRCAPVNLRSVTRTKSFLPMFSTAVTSPWTAAISFFTPSMIWSTESSLPRLSRMKVAR